MIAVLIPFYPLLALGKWLLDKIAAQRIYSLFRRRRNPDECISLLTELLEQANQRRDLFDLDYCLGLALAKAGRFAEALDCLGPYGNDLHTETRRRLSPNGAAGTGRGDVRVARRRGWKKSFLLFSLLVEADRAMGELKNARQHRAFLLECRKHCDPAWLQQFRPHLAWQRRILAFQLGEFAPEELEQWIHQKYGDSPEEIGKEYPEAALTLAEIQALTGRTQEALASCKLLIEREARCHEACRELLKRIEQGAAGPKCCIHKMLLPQEERTAD